MAIVIDALDLIRNKKRLPAEAFFVDANVIIDFKDPFGRTIESLERAKRNEEITEVLGALKGNNIKRFSNISVALEYYKHIQVGFYQTFTKLGSGASRSQKVFDSEDFKKLRDGNVDFMVGWDLQMKVFRTTFIKQFPLYSTNPPLEQIVGDFIGSSVDFGDQVLYKSVMTLDQKMRCIFSNDSDFYSFSDPLYLLCTNPKVIEKAKVARKLLG